MPRHLVIWIGLAIVLLPWTGPAAVEAAKGKLEALLTEAAELAGDGDFEAAAGHFGEALALAQKKGDLVAEGRVAEELDLLFASRTTATLAGEVRSSGGTAPKSRHRGILALLMGKLDAARNGAFVSAPVLARRLLLAATEAGDTDHVALAADVLRKNAKKAKHAGRAAKVVADYAAGLLAVANEKPADATAPLEKALTAAVAEKWSELAFHVSTELAAAWRAAGDDAQAAKALAEAGRLIDEDTSSLRIAAWQQLVTKRLKDAPDTVLEAVREAIARGGKRPPVEVRPSGVGPLGTGFGERKSTDLGRAFTRFSKSKPLVTARRDALGFDVAVRFEPKTQVRVLLRDSVQRHEHGGLTLGFVGRRVALGRVVLENEASKGIQRIQVRDAAAAFQETPVRALYLVAEGETWGVTKRGVVTITPAR